MAEIEFEIPTEEIQRVMELYLERQVSPESYSIFKEMTEDKDKLSENTIYEAAGRTLFNEYIVNTLEWYIKEEKLDELVAEGSDPEGVDTEL